MVVEDELELRDWMSREDAPLVLLEGVVMVWLPCCEEMMMSGERISNLGC